MEVRITQPELPSAIFDAKVRESLLHQVVVMQLNNRRTGTASTKTRGLVRGGGKKPWRQKGTGRARAGSIRSPIWVGGGTVFGPLPKNYHYRLPKKARKQALVSALSLKKREQRLIVVEDVAFPEIGTKHVKEMLKSLSVDSVLLVIPGADRNLELSARNLPNMKVVRTDGLNVYDVLHFDYLVLTQGALGAIQERLSR